ncbi:CinA family protein [Martelella mediterranea]|uniref:Nicotinamide-nucleotide amidase n=1 Tax=Martelella mediterranea TaxID=293089 RepID=A0A4R3NTR8_9HYPH|nr:CinA family protein [Martelella mediterranea]TCT39291.1 nicotinamide-nucleotide amidase [Martelella mediterranea]
MSILDPDLEERSRTLVEYCTRTGQSIVTAESCTGGLIAAALTEIAGASAVVDRGFVTYSNEAKMEMLGVRPDTLEDFGAVSRETALQMASGALWRSNAHLSVAVTGIAGPSGGSEEKPIGLVHLVARNRAGKVHHIESRYGDIGRAAIRRATVRTALGMLEGLAQA